MKRQRNIAIVEDEVLLSMYIEMLVEDQGYRVCGRFAKGEDAVAFAQGSQLDCILMDINLIGQMDGIEAAEKIRETSDVAIVYMTGYNLSDFIERAKKTNPVAYLSKPVEESDLKPIFEELFAEPN